MRDSSNPIVNRGDDKTDEEIEVPDNAETPNTDVHGDPEQVS